MTFQDLFRKLALEFDQDRQWTRPVSYGSFLQECLEEAFDDFGQYVAYCVQFRPLCKGLDVQRILDAEAYVDRQGTYYPADTALLFCNRSN